MPAYTYKDGRVTPGITASYDDLCGCHVVVVGRQLSNREGRSCGAGIHQGGIIKVDGASFAARTANEKMVPCPDRGQEVRSAGRTCSDCGEDLVETPVEVNIGDRVLKTTALVHPDAGFVSPSKSHRSRRSRDVDDVEITGGHIERGQFGTRAANSWRLKRARQDGSVLVRFPSAATVGNSKGCRRVVGRYARGVYGVLAQIFPGGWIDVDGTRISLIGGALATGEARPEPSRPQPLWIEIQRD